jgi:hypothetical protein
MTSFTEIVTPRKGGSSAEPRLTAASASRASATARSTSSATYARRSGSKRSIRSRYSRRSSDAVASPLRIAAACATASDQIPLLTPTR